MTQDKDKTKAQLIDELEALRKEKDKSRKYLDIAGVMLVVLNTDGKVSLINKTGCEILGYNEKEILGKNWFDNFIPENIRTKVKTVFKEMITGNIELVEYADNIVLTSSSEERLIAWHSSLVHDTAGNIIGTLSSGADITERKRAEESLRKSEKFLSDIFESIQDGMSVLNTDLTIRHVNRVMKQWYAKNLPLEGRKCYECYHNRDEVCDPCPTIRCLQSGETESEVVPGLPGSPVEWIELFSYPIKDKDSGEVTGVVEFVRDITERKKAEEALRLERNKLVSIFEAMEDGIYIVDQNHNIEYVNPVLKKDFGPYEGRKCYEFLRDREEVCPWCKNDEVFAGKTVRWEWYSIKNKRTYDLIDTPLKNPDGSISKLEIFRDITEKKNLESQFIHAQKMESVGRLAGGVAHDFNNILTAITGNAELALMSLSPDDPLYEDINEIKECSDRAAQLTRQLLMFSRRQIAEPRTIYLNNMLLDMDKMLRRLIGEDIEFLTVPGADLWPVYIDPGQIEQVLTNLVVNARDAMPGVGKLTVETSNVKLDEEYAQRHTGTEPGDYVMMAVSDTGTGMDEETQSHIFEPFFTTKELGKGTGLGLATCYGIVKQNKGNIWVYSEPGKGTTIKIYLPRAEAEDTGLSKKEEAVDLPEGTETVLAVEDETNVRKMIVRILKNKGYTVLEASNGYEALQIVEKSDAEIHLLLTDVIMPQMGGKELYENLKEICPSTKVLFVSGYTDKAIVHNGFLEAGIRFLQKPFSPSALLRKTRDVLDE